MRGGWWLLALAACGDPTAGPDARGRDAPVFMPGPNLVTIDVTDQTTDVMYRLDGAGPWGLADKVSATEYQLHVTNAYEVAVACGLEWNGHTVLHARTLADGDSDFLFCTADPVVAAAPPAMYAVTGQMVQPGLVTLLFTNDSSSVAPWSYSLNVEAGTYDLIALDSANRIAIRRNITVDAPTTVPSLDTLDEGTPLEDHALSVSSPAIGESLSVETELFTAGGFIVIGDTASRVYVVPASMLVPSDGQYLVVQARSASTLRYTNTADVTQSFVELMPPVTKTTFIYSVPDNNALRGTFAGLPAFTSVEISMYDYRSSQVARFTKSWFETMSRNYFQLDLPPDFDPTWRVSLRPDYDRFVYVNNDDVTTLRTTARYDRVTNVFGN